MTPAEREFAAIRHRIRRDKEGFINRLERNIRKEGECRVWGRAHTGGRVGKGYPSMNLYYEGRAIQIRIHRLFVILRLCRPIQPGYEAAHFKCFNTSCVAHVVEQKRERNRADSARKMRETLRGNRGKREQEGTNEF